MRWLKTNPVAVTSFSPGLEAGAAMAVWVSRTEQREVRGGPDLRTRSGLLLALTFLVESEEMVLLIKKNIGLILKKFLPSKYN